MSEWPLVRLGEVVTYERGLTYSKGDEADLSDVVVLRANNVRLADGRLDLAELRYLRSDFDVPASKYVRRGSILICTASGSKSHLGKVALIDDDLGFAFGGFMGRMDPTELLLPDFLFYCLRSAEYGRFIGDLADGANINNLTWKQLQEFRIPLPPLDEQKRIVAKLDEVTAEADASVGGKDLALAEIVRLKMRVLARVFCQEFADRPWLDEEPITYNFTERAAFGVCNVGGRGETDQVLPRRLSLSVGDTRQPAREGWKWRKLTSISRLESGHTPSRAHPEYWGGDVPWLSIPDARRAHGGVAVEVEEQTNELGLANSAARVLPAGTVCLSRTASVGYVTIMGLPMATSQDFINWVCTEELEPEFLRYLLLAENRDFRDLSSGSVHQTIYVPEAKAFYACVPSLHEQRQVIRYLDSILESLDCLGATVRARGQAADRLIKLIMDSSLQGAA